MAGITPDEVAKMQAAGYSEDDIMSAAGYSPQDIAGAKQTAAPAQDPGFIAGMAGSQDKSSFLSGVGSKLLSGALSAITPPFFTDNQTINKEVATPGQIALPDNLNDQLTAAMANPVANAFPGSGAADLIPGAVTAQRFAFDAAPAPGVSVGQNIQPASNYGNSFRQELEQVPTTFATVGAGMAVGAAAGAIGDSSAAKSGIMEDPTMQAALRYADNQGFLNPTDQANVASGTYTPALQAAAQKAQQHAILTKTAGVDTQGGTVDPKDYLPGVALGYPENNTPRSMAASEQMAQAGPTLLQSGLYSGGERINPYTGTFDGPPSAPMDSYALANKMALASADLLSTRKQVVGNLDEAMQSINKESPGDPKIRGVQFDTDMAPMLGDLQAIIDKRQQTALTQPMSEGMQGAWNNIRQSFAAIKNDSGLNKYSAIGPEGSFENGELLPSQVLSQIENMNAFRKSLGEFDEASRANGMNSTHNDFAGRASELYSLGKVQEAAQAALEGKANEILSQIPNVRGYYSWQDSIGPITPATLPTINKTYASFQTAQEAGLTYGNTTNRGLVAPEPGRLNTVQQQGQDAGGQVLQAATNPVAFGLKKAVNSIYGDTPPQTSASLMADRTFARPAAAISQVLDGLLLRDKTVPILNRDFSSVAEDPNQMQALGARAEAFGLVAPGMFQSLSNPQKQAVHKAVIQTRPDLATQVPGGLNIVSGQYQDPIERDTMMSSALELSASERARVVGAMFQNKYQPINLQSTIPVSKSQVSGALPVTLDRINSALSSDDIPQTPTFDNSYDKEQSGVLDQLHKMTALHTQVQ